MAQITQITPFVMTHDLGKSLSFYCDVLSFDCSFRQDTYEFIKADPVGALRIVEVEPDCEIGEQMIYIDCDDVDAVYRKLQPALALLPGDHLRAPFDQPYGMREFHVKDPDNCLLMFGMDMPSD